MQKYICSYLQSKLGKECKYNKENYDSIYKLATEEYNQNVSKYLSEEITLEKVREFIDLEVAKIKPKSKFFYYDGFYCSFNHSKYRMYIA